MTNATTLSSIPVPSLQTVLQDVNSSFERFCLTAGISALDQMLVEEAEDLAGPRHRRGDGRCGLRWGRRKARSGFTAARRACGRPRVRSQRDSTARLAGRACRGLARALGDEPHADQRADAQAPACGTASGGRFASGSRRRGRRSQRRRVGSWRCRRSACPHGGPRTCRDSTSW
jgi:hypothetical protein